MSITDAVDNWNIFMHSNVVNLNRISHTTVTRITYIFKINYKVEKVINHYKIIVILN